MILLKIGLNEVLISTPFAIVLLIIGNLIIKSDKAKIDDSYTKYGCLGIICIVLGILNFVPLVIWVLRISSMILLLVSILIVLILIVGYVILWIYNILKKIKGE